MGIGHERTPDRYRETGRNVNRSACHGRRSTLGLLFLAAVCTAMPGATAEIVERRIGEGDPRAGYDSPDYVTRSTGLNAFTGIRVDLAALAARPPLGLPTLPDPPPGALIDLGRQLQGCGVHDTGLL